MYRLSLITEEHQEKFFPIAWAYLQEGYQDGGNLYRQEGFLDRLKAGSIQVWVLSFNEEIVGACATELWQLDDGKKRTLHGLLSGGDVVEGMETILETLERFALAQDAVEVAFTLRPGLAKLSRAYGYRTNTIEVRRTLENPHG